MIDHAWTYEAKQARNHLENYEGLVERMAKLMDIPNTCYTPGASDKKKLIDEVLKKMWKFNSTYSIGMLLISSDS